MEARERLAQLDEEEDDFDLFRESSIEDLLRDAPPGCFYCRLRDLEGDDD